MKIDKELITILDKKNFKTFWHCLDHLLIAGYPAMDAMSITLKRFGESKIFSSVAFVRVDRAPYHLFFTNRDDDDARGRNRHPIIIVGLINDNNIQLDGMYGVYRKSLHETKAENWNLPEIEETCEIIKTKELSEFILHYLIGVSYKHFGFEVFTLPKPGGTLEMDFLPPDVPTHLHLESFRDEINKITGIPAGVIDFKVALQNKRNREQL